MDVDFIFRIAAIGIIVAVLNQLLVRSGREEQAMMTNLAGLIVVLMMINQQIDVLFKPLKSKFGIRAMNIVVIAAIAVVAAVLAAMIKRYHQEYAIVISIAAGIIILLEIFANIPPAVRQINALISAAGLSADYLIILLKSLGICFLTQFAADSCRDAGESALSSQVELAGKIAIVVLSLPLFESIAKTVIGLIGT